MTLPKRGEAWHDERVDLDTGEVADDVVTSWPVAAVPSDPGYCAHGMTLGVRCRSCPSGVAERSAA